MRSSDLDNLILKRNLVAFCIDEPYVDGIAGPSRYDAHWRIAGTKWAVFLLSLKALIETGKGAPAPGDLKIDNWN